MDIRIPPIMKVVRFSLMGAGLGLPIVGLGTAFSTALFLHRSLKSTGMVVSLLPQPQEEDGSIDFAPVFRFVAQDGRAFTVKSDVASKPPEFVIGQAVPVVYQVKHPDEARIQSFLQLWFQPVMFGSVGFCSLAAAFGVLLFERRRGPRLNLSGK